MSDAEDKKTEEPTKNSEHAAEPSENAESNSEIQALKNEVAKWKNDFLYLKAEFENFKKRAIKERSDLIRYGGEYAFLGILTVMDNFDRALKVKDDEATLKSFKEGVELIAKEFKTVLQQFGVVEIPSEHQKFDPTLHEAIGSTHSDEVPEGHIVSVIRNPYKFHDKIIRTGQVIVSLGKKKESSDEKDAETAAD